MPNVETKIFLRILTLITLVGGVFLSFYFFSHVFIIVGVSVLLSLILDPFVSLVERKGFSRLLAIIVVFFVISVIAYFSISFLIPKLNFQLQSLWGDLQKVSFHEQLKKLDISISTLFTFIKPGTIANKFEEFIGNAVINSLPQITDSIGNIFSVFIILLIIPFTVFFILKDKNLIIRFIVGLFPNKYFEITYWIIKKVSNNLGRYVTGWIFDAIFVGSACGIGFGIIGLNNSIALALIATFGHLIPYFGPAFVAIPAIIVSLVQWQSFVAVPYILLILAGVYALDNGVVQPYIFSKSVSIHPLVILLLIVAGGQLFGLMGMMLAIPTATVFNTAFIEISYALRNYTVTKN